MAEHPVVVPRVVPKVVPKVVACRVAAPPAAALRADLLVIPWVAVRPVAVHPVAIHPVVPGLGCPRAEWAYPQAEWVAAIVVVAPMAKVAKTAASRVVDSVVEPVAMSRAALASIPAAVKAPSNWARNWTSPLVILTRRLAKNSARWRQWVEIPKVLATAPVALAVPLVWVNRKLAHPVAVAQAVKVLAAAVVLERVRRAPSMA